MFNEMTLFSIFSFLALLSAVMVIVGGLGGIVSAVLGGFATAHSGFDKVLPSRCKILADERSNKGTGEQDAVATMKVATANAATTES